MGEVIGEDDVFYIGFFGVVFVYEEDFLFFDFFELSLCFWNFFFF